MPRKEERREGGGGERTFSLYTRRSFRPRLLYATDNGCSKSSTDFVFKGTDSTSLMNRINWISLEFGVEEEHKERITRKRPRRR